jgi:small subunit ribosomal protein S4
MARYNGPKNRLARREGMDLGYKTPGTKAHAQLLKRLGVGPGQHGAKMKRKTSDFGLQLREKQKVKRMYGVLERQFRKTFAAAKKLKGNTGEKLLEFMERRLDNVIYRMGFSPTRGLSRQLVSHGHVTVDGKKVNIPSFRIEKDMVITLRQKALEIPAVKTAVGETLGVMPAWLERKGPVGKVVRLPERTDIREDINEQLIVEHYSR